MNEDLQKHPNAKAGTKRLYKTFLTLFKNFLLSYSPMLPQFDVVVSVFVHLLLVLWFHLEPACSHWNPLTSRTSPVVPRQMWRNLRICGPFAAVVAVGVRSDARQHFRLCAAPFGRSPRL